MRVGQQLEAVTTAFPDEVFKGVVAASVPISIPTLTRANPMRGAKSRLKLKPQMLARVKIVTNPGSALVVPQQALVFDGDSTVPL